MSGKHGKRCRLIADYESGDGEVVLSEEFLSSYPLIRADILQDWISILTTEYEKALDEMRKEGNPQQQRGKRVSE
jgi:hypothetical protein